MSDIGMQTGGVRELIHRMAVPFALFFLVLAGFLFLSWFFLLPFFTRIDVQGRLMGSRELSVYYDDLHYRVSAAELQRERLTLPRQDPLYEALHVLKTSHPSPLVLQEFIRTVARDTVPDVPDAIRLHTFLYDASMSFHVEGEVSGVGPRSMTILARFVERLRGFPSIVSVESPIFQREQDSSGDFFSPLAITLRFQDDSSAESHL